MKQSVASVKKLPDGTRIFIFGSACYRENPNDVDMLFLYDSTEVKPQVAIAIFEPVINEVQRMLKKSVHAIALSLEEEKNSHFIEKVEALELMTF